jgi:uncharacterized protein YegJ (DUF2314 family)
VHPRRRLVEDRAAEEENFAMTWTLDNAEARAAAHASFKIPSRSEREDLRAGDLAKLIFVDAADRGSARGERMWVEVMAVEVGRYRGRLRNTPVVIQGLEADDPVEFGPDHVADWTAGEARRKGAR